MRRSLCDICKEAIPESSFGTTAFARPSLLAELTHSAWQGRPARIGTARRRRTPNFIDRTP